MNRWLIEDEHADNNMTVSELDKRMEGFLQGEYKAFLFEFDSRMVGYALVNTAVKPKYLRRFFICREERRKGYGREAFQVLFDFLHADELQLDVLSWNEAGLAFWRSVGFAERSRRMRLKKED